FARFLLLVHFLYFSFYFFFFFSSRRRHTRWPRDWGSDVCSSDLPGGAVPFPLRLFPTFRGHPHDPSSAPLRGVPDRRPAAVRRQIGRASCRERVSLSGLTGALERKRRRILAGTHR